MTLAVMDGRRRMTSRQLALFMALMEKSDQEGPNDSPELQRFIQGFVGEYSIDIMFVLMVERCTCGQEVPIVDFIYFGRCRTCSRMVNIEKAIVK